MRPDGMTEVRPLDQTRTAPTKAKRFELLRSLDACDVALDEADQEPTLATG
jgi:hypothetical protein